MFVTVLVTQSRNRDRIDLLEAISSPSLEGEDQGEGGTRVP